MQVEQLVNSYLDWVDKEFMECNRQLSRFNGKWKEFILPGKIKRTIVPEGYVSGQYRLTLDQEQVMELLVGRDLYSDPAVFVRELIQNAIDAVRTREKLDRELPSGWKGQINIRTWRDNEGYHWFRIEDNGIGMTEEIIKNYFLKIGCSYYTSDTFQQLKLRCRADVDYMPISRFGIGILSCFMGDEKTNQVEVSTKHFRELGTYHPALRLSMHGMSGYFYLANKEKQHKPGPMKGVTQKEKEPYLKQPGTVIAVRTNLYQSGSYRGFKEIVDKYVIYPEIPIHYEGEEGVFDYPTEKEFMDTIRSVGKLDASRKHRILEFPISEDDLKKLYEERPELCFKEAPRVVLHCIPLDNYTESPFLSGAILMAKVEAEHNPIALCIGKDKIRVEIKAGLEVDNRKSIKLCLELKFGHEYEEKINIVRREFERVIRYGRTASNINAMGPLANEIMSGIGSFDILNLEWETYMAGEYKISMDELHEKTEKILRQLSNEMKDHKIDRDILKKMRDYTLLTREWKFEVCNLESYEWYDKYFLKKYSKKQKRDITSHNGILCGDAAFFYKSEYREYNLGTILLLKDKYRPFVDVARNKIRTLTLETLCDLETIRYQLKEEDIEIDGDSIEKVGRKLCHISAKAYMDILEVRGDFEKRIKYHTDEGVLSFEQLKKRIEEGEKIGLKRFPTIGAWGWYEDKSVYRFISIALLKKYFSLIGKKDKRAYSRRYSVFVTKKESENISSVDIFPVSFFVKTEETSEKLVSSSVYDRYFCNEQHVLSQFILKNGEKMREYVPGILEEMLRTLAEDEMDSIINNVNNLLLCLRNLPEGIFQVPGDLILTESDFY